MEEHHAKDLASYYNSLAVHQHHNYYEGRSKVDLTSWIKYFTVLLSEVFARAKDEATQYAKTGVPVEPEKLRGMDRRARIVLGLFAKKDQIATDDIVKVLGLSNRMVRVLAQKWVKDGWLTVADKANRSRAYGLSAVYRQFIGKLSAT